MFISWAKENYVDIDTITIGAQFGLILFENSHEVVYESRCT